MARGCEVSPLMLAAAGFLHEMQDSTLMRWLDGRCAGLVSRLLATTWPQHIPTATSP